jgi:hypothetical protein
MTKTMTQAAPKSKSDTLPKSRPFESIIAINLLRWEIGKGDVFNLIMKQLLIINCQLSINNLNIFHQRSQ